MLKKKKQETLAERIANDLNIVQASFDPEDENLDDTRAQVDENLIEEDDGEEEILSQFRKQNVTLLADIDERYAGKKGSRKTVNDYDAESSESDEQSEAGSTENSDVDSINGESPRSNAEESEEEATGSEGETDDGSGENETDDASAEDEMDYEGDSIEEDENFKHLKASDVSSQVKNGLSVRNQMKMWESLLETRIQLQKCLIAANKMPESKTFVEIKKKSGQEFSNQVAVTKNSLGNVLDKLLLLQKLVLKKYPETKNLDETEKKVSEEEGNEEIASDTDEEKSAEESEVEERDVPKKKRKWKELEKEINEQHLKYKKYRNSVIQKWNEKTRIAVMKNNTNSHSVVNHIEYTLRDRAKLVKRTRLKRSDYTIIGQEPPMESEKQNEELPVEEYNPEIFDDDDFYHQLLRELIEVKSADLTDPVQLGRQWIQLQNLRSKMKRKIDTRATKGRKIRYAVHSKLVNFMAPIDEHLWTDDAKTELYNSLFGKNQQFATA